MRCASRLWGSVIIGHGGVALAVFPQCSRRVLVLPCSRRVLAVFSPCSFSSRFLAQGGSAVGTQMRTHMRTQMGHGGNSVVRTRWEHREKTRALAVLSPFSCRALAVFSLCSRRVLLVVFPRTRSTEGTQMRTQMRTQMGTRWELCENTTRLRCEHREKTVVLGARLGGQLKPGSQRLLSLAVPEGSQCLMFQEFQVVIP